MQAKKLEDLTSEYELELVKAAKAIKKNKSKKVLLQFPDGFKPYAIEIKNEIIRLLGKNNKAEFFIWLDTCFGACDVPLETERLGIDLIIQFGHSPWDYSNKKEFGIKTIK